MSHRNMLNRLKWGIGLAVLLIMFMMTQNLYAAGIQIVTPNGNEYFDWQSPIIIKWNYQQVDNSTIKIELLKSGNVTQLITI